MQVSYSIFPASPEAHLYEVQCVIEKPNADGQIVSLPAWIPGSYMIRDFAKNIVRFQATCHDQPVDYQKIDKDTWKIASVNGTLKITYRIYALDLSVRSAHLDNTHGFFNGTSVFLRVHGLESEPCAVNIQKPRDKQYSHWSIATSMRSLDAPLKNVHGRCEFGNFVADNYMDLIEHPVEMGDFDWFAFEACGVPHYVALTGRHWADQERLSSDLQTICEHHIRFFGEPAPVDRYVFLVTITGDGYGGLEHTHSTALLCSRKHLPRVNEQEINNDYREFLGLCSHEYFHTWNVKRIKPAEFIPFDLQKENYTKQLWAFEGITSYYDDLALLRSGLIDVESYLELLSKTLTRLQQTKGRKLQTVTESSFDAWTKFYKQDQNAINAIVSYYTKGAVIALLLDLKLRELSPFSLDEIMRILWRDYCSNPADYQGIQADRILLIILSKVEETLPLEQSQKIQQQIKDFWHSVLHTTDELPVEAMLETIGISQTMVTAYPEKTTAGEPNKNKLSSLGVRLQTDRVNSGNFPLITHIYNDSAAEKAGLSSGDIIVSLNGIKAQMPEFEQQIRHFAPGTTITVHAFRRDELMQFDITLLALEPDTITLKLNDAAASRQQARANWQT